jgi:uncharacterized membrane protein
LLNKVGKLSINQVPWWHASSKRGIFLGLLSLILTLVVTQALLGVAFGNLDKCYYLAVGGVYGMGNISKLWAIHG